MTGPADEPEIDFDLPDATDRRDPDEMHGKRIQFGKYAGERWTRIPLGYIKHLANSGFGEPQQFAQLELKRRGYLWTPEVEITGHAIDRASIKLRMNWMATRESPEEGLHTWLARVAGQAYASHGAPELRETEEPYDITTFYQGMKLIFTVGYHAPVLKTIMPKEDHRGNIRLSRRR